jgi:hypothetical protein
LGVDEVAAGDDDESRKYQLFRLNLTQGSEKSVWWLSRFAFIAK